MVFTVAPLVISAIALAAAEAASLVTVADTRVFPESISVTSDGTLLIAGSGKGIMFLKDIAKNNCFKMGVIARLDRAIQ